ncbi:MAG: hypothetical protein IJ558_01085 [Treponema sp.]|nr:hypothetical protein [Treponema sp.]
MKEDDEIKIVTREETFNDLAVRELAKGKAACICRLQFKRCMKNQCKTCPCAQKFNNCVNEMSEYDRLRLDTYTAEYYVKYSRNPDSWMSHNRFVLFYIKLFFLIMASMLIICLFFGFMMDLYINL